MTNDPMLLPIVKFLFAMLLFAFLLDRFLTALDWRLRERKAGNEKGPARER